jgi:hypothetical protein
MTSSRRRQWWNVIRGAELTKDYWRHECGYLIITVCKDNRCESCGLNEEEYGRLKSERSEGRISST